jgi:hypothetical protein
LGGPLKRSVGHLRDMKLNRRAALIACIAALPFITLASYSWVKAATDKSFPAYEADHFGDLIYLLGSPLTLVVLGIPYYAGVYLDHGFDWFWIPLVDCLFVLQWMVWSQLISRIAEQKPPGQRILDDRV